MSAGEHRPNRQLTIERAAAEKDFEMSAHPESSGEAPAASSIDNGDVVVTKKNTVMVKRIAVGGEVQAEAEEPRRRIPVGPTEFDFLKCCEPRREH